MPADVLETQIYTTTVKGPAGGDPRTAASVRAMGSGLASRTLWLKKQLDRLLGEFMAITAVDTTTDTLTIAGHGYTIGADDTIVRIASVGGSVPGGINTGDCYYVIGIDADTLQLGYAAGGAGPVVDLTNSGSGALYLYEVPDVLSSLFTSVVTFNGGHVVNGVSLKSIFASIVSKYGGTFVGAVAIDGTFGSLVLGGLKRLTYASRSLPRASRGLMYNEVAGTVSSYSLPVGTSEVGRQDLDCMPNGSVMTSVTFYVDRTNLGTLPTTRVKAALYRQNVVTGALTPLYSPTEDPTAVLAPYEARHAITLSGWAAETVDRTVSVYFVQLEGEAGSNTSPVAMSPAVVTCTVSSQDEMV